MNARPSALAALAVIGVALYCATALAGKRTEQEEHDAARAVLTKATIELTAAIGTAQAKAPTGKPIYAMVEQEDGKSLFEIYLLVGDSITEIEVDATSGVVVRVEENVNDEVDNLAQVKQTLAASKLTFAQAIAAAAAKVEGGKAFEVELKRKADQPIVEVELVVGDKFLRVEVDAMSGKVLEVEEE